MKLEGVLNFLLSEWHLSRGHGRKNGHISFCRQMGVFNLEGLKIPNGVGFNFDGNVVSLIELMMLHIVSAFSLRSTHFAKNSVDWSIWEYTWDLKNV